MSNSKIYSPLCSVCGKSGDKHSIIKTGNGFELACYAELEAQENSGSTLTALEIFVISGKSPTYQGALRLVADAAADTANKVQNERQRVEDKCILEALVGYSNSMLKSILTSPTATQSIPPIFDEIGFAINVLKKRLNERATNETNDSK